jgi:O-antigen/teichoic acid export membrane protein
MTPRGSGAGGWLAWMHPAAISRTWNILLSTPVNVLLALIPLAVVPIYIRLIGAEAYGLVVLNATILSTILFLDRLVAPAIIREFGRKNGDAAEAEGMGTLLKSFEGVALALGGLAMAVALLAIWYLTPGWGERVGLDRTGMRAAFVLMAFVIGVQWPGLLYTAALTGLQRQAVASGARLAGVLLLHAGGVMVLLFMRADILALLAWQAVAFLVQSLVLRWITWSVMPVASVAPTASREALRGVWRMAVGSLLIGLAASLISQIDKFMVARLFPPDQFTAYGLSFMVAGAAFNVLTGPLSSAMQPHFARLIEAGDEAELANAYNRWSQVLALFAIPLGTMMMSFSGPLVDLWLGMDTPLSAKVKSTLPVAALCVLLVALLAPAALLQGAAAWNGLTLGCHAITATTLLLALPIVVARHGPWGAAALSAGLTAMYFFVMIPLMHSRLLRGRFWDSTLRNIFLPLVVMLSVVVFTAFFPTVREFFPTLFRGIITICVMFFILIALLPLARNQIFISTNFIIRNFKQ